MHTRRASYRAHGVGYAWIFSRFGDLWEQQGEQLISVYSSHYTKFTSFVSLIIVSTRMFNNYVLIHCALQEVSRLQIIIACPAVSVIMKQKIRNPLSRASAHTTVGLMVVCRLGNTSRAFIIFHYWMINQSPFFLPLD